MNRIESLINEVAKKINKLMPDLEEADRMFANMEEGEISQKSFGQEGTPRELLHQIAYAEVNQKIGFYQEMLAEALEIENFSIEEVLYLKEEIQKKLNQENASLVLNKMFAPTLKRLENRQRSN